MSENEDTSEEKSIDITKMEHQVEERAEVNKIGDQELRAMPDTDDLNLSFTITAGDLRKMLDTIKRLVDEVRFKLVIDEGEPYLHVKAVDNSHVAMLDLKIYPQYVGGSLQAKREWEFGIHAKSFHGYLSPRDVFPSGRALTLGFTDDEMIIEYRLKGAKILRRFKLMDTAGISDPKVPALNLPAILKDAPVGDLKRILKAEFNVRPQNKDFSDHLRIQAEPRNKNVADAVIFSNPEYNPAYVELDADFVTANDPFDPKQPIVSLFPVDYFYKILIGIEKHTKQADIHIGTDYPVRIHFETEGLKGHYLLAPRIESD